MERKFGLNTFVLKMIAIVTMLIDHVGVVLFPQYLILRFIGRMAFPIFAYTLVEGFIHTRDISKYMKRLGVMALVSEIPFDLVFYGVPFAFVHQNVFFTLFLGILMLDLFVKTPIKWRQFLWVLIIFLLGDFLRSDYGSMGLLIIFLFYYWRTSKVWKLAGMSLVNVCLMGGSQVYAVASALPIALHNGEQGPKCKWFFYGFYPVHLLILYVISILI